MNMILLGAPGSGKGTHSPGLTAKYGIPSISSGDIFREQLKNQTPLGLKAKSFMDKGELVPDDLVIEIILSRLEGDDVKDGIILDGFPRTQEQAEKLDAYLEKQGKKIDIAMYIDVTPEIVIQRLAGRRVCRDCGATFNVDTMPPKVAGVCDKCGGELYQRDDDREETVRNRLDIYEKSTAGLIGYYESRGVLAKVDGTLHKDETLALMNKIIDDFKK